MIGIGLIRRKTEKVRTALSKRMDHVDFSEVLGWDKERRELIFEIDSLREKRNRVSSQVPLMKKEGKDVVQYIKEMKTVSKRIKDLNLQLLEKERKIKSFLEALPNIPDDDVPEGGKENNEVIRSWGKKPEFSFKPQNHVDLVNNLDLVDYERGMIRGHQFNKVEIFQFSRPEDSDNALDQMIREAERLVRGLGIHYRVSKLAARDLSASMAKTYDVEIWIPSMGDYKEVSSASNARDYQARRGNIRFKRKTTGKNEYVNTLNASGLATSRLLPAIVEQFQEKDGSVQIPECLRKWFPKDRISSKNP